MDKMSIYNHLPIWGQNIACHIEGHKILKTRYSQQFWNKLNEYEDRARWSYERLCDYRDKQLHKLSIHAYKTVPYYHKLFDESGVAPESINTVDDLKQLPVLTKEIIKKEPEAFISNVFDKEKLITSHTSGTTGNGFIFKTTREAICEQWAVWWRYRRKVGIKFDDWCALLGGRSVVSISQNKPPFFRWNRPCKQLYFSTYHMNYENLKWYVQTIIDNQINWIHGYPSAINLLADYMLQNHIKVDIEFITTGAENLLESQKEKIRLAFGHEPYQHYGLSEGTANFSEELDHKMVVDEDFAAVEFIENGNGSCSVVGTNLTNFGMPFIRYNTGDVCNAVETKNGRIITSIDGRKEDYLILSDGTKVGRLDHIFKDMVNVREAQFVQKSPGLADLNIVRAQGFSNDDEIKLKREIYSRLKNIDVRIIYVDSIKRTDNGKFRFVISE